MSSKEDIAFRKLSMLMKAVTEANERETLKNAENDVLRELANLRKKNDVQVSNVG